MIHNPFLLYSKVLVFYQISILKKILFKNLTQDFLSDIINFKKKIKIICMTFYHHIWPTAKRDGRL